MHPFAGKANSAQMIAAHLAETPAPLTTRNTEVSATLNDLVQRCLAKDATHRPANADEVLQCLESVAMQTPFLSPRLTTNRICLLTE